MDDRTALKVADITTIVIMVFVLALFLTYFQTKANIDSPLIPEWTVGVVMGPYMLKGCILTTGLIVGMIFRRFGQIRTQIWLNALLIVFSFTFFYAYSFIMS
ncbi:MAG: hypothetical protein JNL52_12510 [Flavobacteriales bacterium]|nr:hypothetical protein [Flavobacteriales bacterium]